MKNMKDLVGKKVLIKYDNNLMLPYLCTVIKVDEGLRWFKAKEFNSHWYTLDAILCCTEQDHSNAILSMKRQLDELVERNRTMEKEMKDEIMKYISQVNRI